MKFDNYINYLLTEKHYSKHTITAYSIDLKQFEDFIQKVFEIYEAKDVTSSMIRDWIVHLSENKITNRSINRKITTLRSYFRYLLKIQELEINPLLKILPVKTSTRNPVFIMQEDMSRIINMEYEKDFEGIRNKLIIELLYATGMRKSELFNLEEKDFDYQRQEIRIFGKRRKERIVPMHKEIIDLLYQYLEQKNIIGKGEKRLLVNRDCSPISIYQLNIIVRESLSTSQVERKSPHILRHTFATHLLNEGADIMNVKDLLGHASLEATQIYTHNTIEKLKSVYKQKHPRSE
ncbi:MAG TPA: tyrosine-type recombinase/integrase [Bacteroidales bacterium]|nr:tyrosine-type recombinase/integrase [Bacteroidales bacterium]